MICNHRTRIDWVFIWNLCARTGQLGMLKIVLKNSIRHVPGFGWGMQIMSWIFLTREKEMDLPHIKRAICFANHWKDRNALLIFPEGTDLSPKSLSLSHAFSQEKGLQKYEFILHPKTKGFVECLQTMRSNMDALYDLTVAYRDFTIGERPDEASLLKGELPREVHIFIERIAVKDIPETEKEMTHFCSSSFQRKENRLSAFYSHGNTSGEFKFLEADNISIQMPLPFLFYFYCVAFWILLTYSLIHFLWSKYLILYFIFCTCLFLHWTNSGGIDMIELDTHEPQLVKE